MLKAVLKKRCISSLLVLGCLAVFLGSCGTRESRVEWANREKLLLLGNGPEPRDLDPHVVTGVSEINILTALFEGLVTPGSEDLSPQPGVAENWETSPDGKIWTFYLRENAAWSNGDPVTAGDFVFAWKRLLSPELGAPYASNLFFIEGAESYNSGDYLDFESSVGITALQDRVLEIRLKHPVDNFLNRLLHPVWSPLHEGSIASKGPITRRSTGWTRAGSMVSNGPFQLKSWRVNEFVEVSRNTYYWDAARVHLNGIHFYTIPDQNTEERAFLAGQLHVTESLPAAKVAHYRKTESPWLRIDPYSGTEYYLLNTRRPPLDNIQVRRAFSLALKRRVLVDAVLQAGQIPASSFTPPGTAGYTASTKLNEDPDQARLLLKAAGYGEESNMPELTLLINTSERNRAVAEVIQEMWRKNLGTPVEIQNMEWKVYLSARENGDFTIARASWIADFVDPMDFLGLWGSASSNNYSGWKNAGYDRLLEEAGQATDLGKKNELLGQAEQILIDEMPVIPLYHYVTAYLIRPEVKNWHPTPLDWHPYKYVELEE